MTTGSNITAVSYNTIQDKVQSILGTGIGSRGYGQSLNSSDVSSGAMITKAQWDALKFDIINAKFHQDGTLPTIVTVNSGDVISYGAGSPNFNYDSIVETAIANRFNIGIGQSVVSAAASASTSSTWSTQAQVILTSTFSTADQARYFFNSGGKLRVTSTLVGGSGTQQVNAWRNFLSSTGTQDFGAANTFVNFYTLTTSYQTYYQNSLSTPYSANFYRLEARCNVSDNSNGTATEVYIRVTLSDSYVDPGAPAPGDSVDGTLTIAVDELKASGTMLPSGSFTITSPTHSISAITLS